MQVLFIINIIIILITLNRSYSTGMVDYLNPLCLELILKKLFR